MPSPDNTSIAPAFAVENPIGFFPNRSLMHRCLL